ncbi:MAG: aspartate aminotransferase family protein [endosymbiont of Galathealinum brachiosum]|uniref:Acetylornithine aminotransferase n=1 Tax=endosymbiont of Galathealinum brachiosum TaxID=2200906 RepID=A0A370DA06_9GAMM|nr:MAG: aspartate aminotransferase family protein [endosymbiont of Galathealinum brachiosum]
MKTYAPLDVCFDRGEGVYLYDDKGTEYLDALAGIAVCGLGHAHPTVTSAIQSQAEKLLHTSNLYCIQNQQQLADNLCHVSGMERIFFSNSGAEANEAAIKLARLYGNQQDIENPSIIVTDGSFHGRTLATLSATGNRKVHAGFEPLVSGFIRAPYNDVEAIKSIAQNSSNTVAVLVEPIQGEGGITLPDENYLTELRAICDENNWLLMLDEIQTGMGRTGAWFAFQHNNIKPDVMTLAKGLGNGVPIGACLAHGKAAELFQPGNHGSTFGGNPLACAAANAVIETITKDDLCKRADELGRRMLNGFEEQLKGLTSVNSIRGKGLMIGIELDRDCPELVAQALAKHCLINVTAGSVVRLLPPLILSDEQADTIVNLVSSLIKDFLN